MTRQPSYLAAYFVAISSLLAGAAFTHNLLKPDLVRLSGFKPPGAAARPAESGTEWQNMNVAVLTPPPTSKPVCSALPFSRMRRSAPRSSW